MTEPIPAELAVRVRACEGGWQVTLERDGDRRELADLRELIRYLEAIAASAERPVRGLR